MSRLSDNSDVKDRIKAEFLACLREFPYAQVSVKDLVERLGMSRQNFYRYYTSKEDILIDIVDDTFDRIYLLIEANIREIEMEPSRFFERVSPVFLLNRGLIREVLDRGTDDIVFSHSRRFVRRCVGRLLREKNMTVVNHDYLDVLIAKTAGGGFYAVKTWSQLAGDLDADDLRRLLLPLLEDLIGSLQHVAT